MRTVVWQRLWHGRARIALGVLLAGMAWGMSACAIFPMLEQGRVVVPQCVREPPRPTPLPNAQDGFGSAVMSDQMPATLGFKPLLATYLPADVTWNGMIGDGPPPGIMPLPRGFVAPLFHATYRLVTSPTKFGPYNSAVLALDETTVSLSPTSLYVGGDGFRVEDQTAVRVGTASAMLYYLAPPEQDQATAGVTVVTVVWWADGVWLQLTAVRGGAFQLAFSPQARVPLAPGAPAGGPPPDPALGVVTNWTGASDAAVLAVARSVSLYSGCDAGQ